MAKLMFVDLETTGFSRQWDSIIEIAAILYDEEEDRIIDEFSEYIKPSKSIPSKITEITGIDDWKVRDALDEKTVLGKFLEWVYINKPSKVVGHNYISFDKTFLIEKFIKYGYKMFDIEEIDTLKVARAKKVPVTILTSTGLPSYTQESLAKFYGIEYQAHRAIEDVRALVKIYKKMTEIDSVKTTRDKLGF